MNTQTRPTRSRRRNVRTAFLPFPASAPPAPALAIHSPVRRTPPAPPRQPRPSVWTDPVARTAPRFPVPRSQQVATEPQEGDASLFLDLLGAAVVMGLVLLAVILV